MKKPRLIATVISTALSYIKNSSCQFTEFFRQPIGFLQILYNSLLGVRIAEIMRNGCSSSNLFTEISFVYHQGP